MAGGREFSHTQRKIINRYYEHKETILATKLGEIVGDMALAAGDAKKLDKLWKRAETALAALLKDSAPGGPPPPVPPAEVRRVLTERSVERLAKLMSRLS